MARRRKNVQMGYVDKSGVFHPIRASSDYSPGAVGERKRKRKPARKARKRVGAKKRKGSAPKRKRKNPAGVPGGWIRASAVKITRLPGGGVNVKVKQ